MTRISLATQEQRCQHDEHKTRRARLGAGDRPKAPTPPEILAKSGVRRGRDFGRVGLQFGSLVDGLAVRGELSFGLPRALVCALLSPYGVTVNDALWLMLPHAPDLIGAELVKMLDEAFEPLGLMPDIVGDPDDMETLICFDDAQRSVLFLSIQAGRI